jgi:hypothetical protein
MTDLKNLGLGGGCELSPDLSGPIHSCSFCCVQEIDPCLKEFIPRNDLTTGTVVKYRGLRVLDGASNGCAFFKVALDLLESILSEHGYNQGSASPNFRPENWIYELFFSDHTGYLETAAGEWKCSEGELLRDTQQPPQERARYFVVADQGKPVD